MTIETTAVCKHCGWTIVEGPPSPDRYWYHPRTQSVYCARLPGTKDTKAEPQGRTA